MMEAMTHTRTVLEATASGVELVSAGILILGFAKALAGFLRAEWKGLRNEDVQAVLPWLRLQLGKYILLGLDCYIVSDIIHSMIRPGWDELLSLGIIVLLRSAIGFFLGRELSEIEKNKTTSVCHAEDVQKRGL